MSPASDPAEMTAPKDPADYRPRRATGLGGWAIVAFGLACVIAGGAIASFAPRLLAARPTPVQVAELQPAQPPATAPAPASVTPVPPPVPINPSAELGQLSARVAALETHETRTTQAAATALAAAALVEVSQGSRPFADELAALRRAGPSGQELAAPELAALARVADTGAPSRAALAAGFPDYAARAASASRAPGDGAGPGDRIAYALSRIVSVRRVGDVPGNRTDALLARAERLVEDGDLDGALRTLDGLPPAAREAMAPWRARAERRAEVDRQIGALRARALRDLSAAGSSE